MGTLQYQAKTAMDDYSVVDVAMDTISTVSVGKNNGFFGRLPPKRRRYLESKLRRIEYPPGTQIIKKGLSGQFMAIVESGQVVLENGRSQSRILTAGEYFGSEMLIDGKPSAYSISTRTETVLSVLHRVDWMSPSSQRQSERGLTAQSPIKKSIWRLLIVLITLVLGTFMLGPPLLEISNNTLPALLVDAGHPDLAESYLRIVIDWGNPSARLYGDLGDILAQEGNKEEAIENYQQAITEDAYMPWIHNNLGVLYYQEGKPEQAVDHFLQSINLNPQNSDTYRNLGNAYYALEEWGAAANAYQGALDINSNLLDTKAARAGLLIYQGELDQARLTMEEVLIDEPRHKLALQGLGLISMLEDDPYLAMLYLDAASYLDPNDTLTRLYTGMTLEAMDKNLEALAEYRFVLERETDPHLRGVANSLLKVALE